MIAEAVMELHREFYPESRRLEPGTILWETTKAGEQAKVSCVLDMGSSPTHKGIICRKLEEGMSPPDIARATGHTLAAVDNYLGTYERVKVLLRKGFDAPTICQVTGKAARTIAQYLVVAEQFHPELIRPEHRDWLTARRRRAHEAVQLEPAGAARMIRSCQRPLNTPPESPVEISPT